MQRQVLVELLKSIDKYPENVEEEKQAAAELQSQLLSLTEMYNNYAIKFRLHESKLYILFCADYRDE